MRRKAVVTDRIHPLAEIDCVVGTLGRAHGLLGAMFVDLRTDSPQLRFRRGAVVYSDGHPFTVSSFSMQGARGLVRFDEVRDRSAAEALTGSELVAIVDENETTDEEGVYFDHQLVGLPVVTESGEAVGDVVRVEHLGFQDMLVVSVSGEERLIPFVDDLVPDVDLEAGRIVVRAIPGLLEDTDEA